MVKKTLKGLAKKVANNLYLNDEDVSYINKINNSSALEWIKLKKAEDLAPFTYSFEEVSSQQDKIASHLKENGLLIIKNFIPEVNATKYASAAQNVIRESLNKVKDNSKDFEDETIFIQNTTHQLKTYSDLSNYPKTVMVNRKGRDSGMIDIFNYDVSFKEASEGLRQLIGNEVIVSIISKAINQQLQPANLNVYYNKNVLQTRPFHVDSYGKHQYKAFLYLTDVNSIADGPYCYVVKSHTDKSLIRANRGISKLKSGVQTDAYFYEYQNAYPVLGIKGTLVISDQSGIHRGHPQAEGHERIVAVMNYKN